MNVMRVTTSGVCVCACARDVCIRHREPQELLRFEGGRICFTSTSIPQKAIYPEYNLHLCIAFF